MERKRLLLVALGLVVMVLVLIEAVTQHPIVFIALLIFLVFSVAFTLLKK